MSTPTISIVTPVYNTEPYLEETIRSMLDQSFPDFEFILVDDGSSDRSVEIIRSFDDPRIVLLQNPYNIGNYPSRNRGHRIARGKYICVMDSDDIAMPERLAEQFLYMESHPAVGISGSNCIRIPENRESHLGLSAEEFKVGLIANNMIFFHPTLIMRKAMLEKFRLEYDEIYIFGSDYELLTRGVLHFEITNQEKVLLQYRKHENCITSRHSRVQRFMVRQVMRKYLSVLELYPTSEEMDIHFRLMWGGAHGLNKDEIRQWLDKILAANERIRYFDHELLRNLLDVKSQYILNKYKLKISLY